MRLAVIFHRFGPYHAARLAAVAGVCEVTAIELAAETAEYAWDKIEGSTHFQRVTLFPVGDSRTAELGELQQRMNLALQKCRPEVVAIPGWSEPGALAALLWCSETGTPVVLMSESTAHDERRVWWKEWLKRRVVRLCSTALVGGRLHADYLEQLGMALERVFTGYDVVENKHFSAKAEESRKQKAESSSLPPSPPRSGRGTEGEVSQSETLKTHKDESLTPHPASGHLLPSGCGEGKFFLASARFIEKKNLPRLIEAYALYRETVQAEDRGLKAEDRSQRTEVADAPAFNPQSPILNPQSSIPSEFSTPISAFSIQHSAFPQVPWDIVLLGDGPLRADLCSLIADLSLQDSVLMPGFKQYDELPAWYARASAFVHASTSEQWGLVVNEACAAGLPVLVSNRCGCAPELVQEGVNGFTFDPNDARELAALMVDMAQRPDRAAMGRESERIVSHWRPAAFATGLLQAAELAAAQPRRPAGWFDRFLLKCLMRR